MKPIEVLVRAEPNLWTVEIPAMRVCRHVILLFAVCLSDESCSNEVLQMTSNRKAETMRTLVTRHVFKNRVVNDL